MQLYSGYTGKGTYQTRDRAVKRAEKACQDFNEEFRYIIMATPDGRFAPVIILTSRQQYLCGPLAHNGICVTF